MEPVSSVDSDEEEPLPIRLIMQNFRVSQKRKGRSQHHTGMDSQKRALLNEIWFKFLLFLNSAHVFPEDFSECFNYDLYQTMENYINGQGPPPQPQELADRLQRYISSRFLFKNNQLTALVNNPVEAIKTHLVNPLVKLWNDYSDISNGNTLPIRRDTTTTSQPYWDNHVDLPHLDVHSEISGNRTQEEKCSSGAPEYNKIIADGYVLATTCSRRNDEEVPNETSVKVPVKLESGLVQIGEMCPLDLGPSTSSKYKPIPLPSGDWPRTVPDFWKGANTFVENMSVMVYHYVPQEEPTLRPYKRRTDFTEQNKLQEEELDRLEDKNNKGRATESDVEKIGDLRKRVKQNKNTLAKFDKEREKLDDREQLYKKLQRVTGQYHAAVRAAIHSTKLTTDGFLRIKLEETIRTICNFVEDEKRKVEDKDVLLKKPSENKNKLQLLGWKWECNWLEELRDLLTRLTMIAKLSSTGVPPKAGDLKRHPSPRPDEPPVKINRNDPEPDEQITNVDSAEMVTNAPKDENEQGQGQSVTMSSEEDGLPIDWFEYIDSTRVSVLWNFGQEDNESHHAANSLEAEEQENKAISEGIDNALDRNLQGGQNSPPLSDLPAIASHHRVAIRSVSVRTDGRTERKPTLSHLLLASVPGLETEDH